MKVTSGVRLFLLQQGPWPGQQMPHDEVRVGSCKANTSGHCPPGPRQLRGMDSHLPWPRLQVPIPTCLYH